MRKNILKRMIIVVLMASLLFTCVGCVHTDDNNPNAVKLKVVVFDGGYGLQVWERLADEYEKTNKDVSISVETTIDAESDLNKISTGIHVADLYTGTWAINDRGRRGDFLPLNDVYESIPNGESLSIKEKLGGNAQMFAVSDGNYYALPAYQSLCGLLYNKDTLDEVLGEGNYTLPRTSDELYSFCLDIKDDVYPFVYTHDLEADYGAYMAHYFYVQYAGYEAYKQNMNGNYLDAMGKWTFDSTGENIYADPAKRVAFTETQKFLSSKNGFVPSDCKFMDYMDAQQYFWGLGYGSSTKKAAFMLNGDWMYKEMDFLKEVKDSDIRFMKFPVNSRIVSICKSVQDDAELVALIDAIDVNGKTTPLVGNGYSVLQEDFDKIFEARNMIFSNYVVQNWSIPATTKYPEQVKDFLVFLSSDYACNIYSNELYGDVSPFNNSISDGRVKNEFIASKLAILNENSKIVSWVWDTEKFQVWYLSAFNGFTLKAFNGELLSELDKESNRTAFTRYYQEKLSSSGVN
ncbi:MAG: hypothetical protein DBX97_03120 [Collinsella tanakaei]|nr:MAG: hypothetical protein DBX97_03120 [Collinsella tanakaei]